MQLINPLTQPITYLPQTINYLLLLPQRINNLPQPNCIFSLNYNNKNCWILFVNGNNKLLCVCTIISNVNCTLDSIHKYRQTFD